MASIDIPDFLYEQLHTARCKTGVKRQKRFKNSILQLNNLLTSAKHPYQQYSYELAKVNVDGFDPAGKWVKGVVNSNEYLYRIENFTSFIRNNARFFNPPSAGGYTVSLNSLEYDNLILESEEIWNQIIIESKKNNYNWLQLNKLTTKYLSRRNVSWWTTDHPNHVIEKLVDPATEISLKNKLLAEMAFKVGMVNEWLNKQILLIRCPTKIVGSYIKVPSIVDAYCQPIFNPQPEKPQPTYGQALSIGKPVSSGYKEFLLVDPPVDEFSFIPIPLNKNYINRIFPNHTMTEELIFDIMKHL